MNTKLTLRLDDELIKTAKRHSDRSGKSVSQLVADYFTLIDSAETPRAGALTPRVKSLLGASSGATVDERDYRKHLEEKYL